MAIPDSSTYTGIHFDNQNNRLTIRLDNDEYFRADKGQHTRILSITDGKNIRINSRNVTQTSGDHSAVQVKPNQTVATASITGIESSPRFAAGIAGTNLIGIKSDPLLKGGSGGNIGGEITAFQANIDFGTTDSRVITGDVSALDAFLAIPSDNTYNGDVALLRVKTVNIRAWDYFMNIDDANTGVETLASGTYSTAEGYLKIVIGSTDYRLPYYSGVD